MKHLTMAEKSLLLGDEAADLLLEYASLLGQNDSADTVTLRAYGDDGDPVDVTFLLNSGTSILVQTSESVMTEPENSEGIRYMRERMRLIESPPPAQPMESSPSRTDWEL
jgi:hypothetical protein